MLTGSRFAIDARFSALGEDAITRRATVELVLCAQDFEQLAGFVRQRKKPAQAMLGAGYVTATSVVHVISRGPFL